jgi:hypothetical protein
VIRRDCERTCKECGNDAYLIEDDEYHAVYQCEDGHITELVNPNIP